MAMSLVVLVTACNKPHQKGHMVTVGVEGEGPATGHVSDNTIYHRRHCIGWGGNMSDYAPSSSGNSPSSFPVGSL